MLGDPLVLDLIQAALTDYFHRNSTPDVHPTLVWNTQKAVIRRVVIQEASRRICHRELLTRSLEDLFAHLSSLFGRRPRPDLRNQLELVRQQLDYSKSGPKPVFTLGAINLTQC